MGLEELYQKLNELRHQQQQIIEGVEAQNRNAATELTPDETQTFQRLDAEMDKLEDAIQRAEKDAKRKKRIDDFENRQAELRESAREPAQPATDLPQRMVKRFETDEYADACMDFLRNGLDQLTPEVRTVLQVDSDSSGGFVVASNRLISAILKNADNNSVIRQVATVYPCGYHETLGAPALIKDLTNFKPAGELTEAEEDDLQFGRRELKPHPFQRKVVPVSRRLLESGRLDVEGMVAQRIGYKLGDSEESLFCTGTGADQALGFFVASAEGISTDRDVSTGNLATSPTIDGFINAQDALKEAYQTNAQWLLHRNAITKIRLLKDGQGLYIWQPGTRSGEPNTILGKPYIKSEYCPNTFTANQYFGIYGDFSYYWIADAISLIIQRLDELYALKGQIGLMCDRMAVDGMPVQEEAFVRMQLANS